MEKTYGQFCPMAAGLDLLGDRWVLLICRELNLGDQRFTDLRAALPGIAPNLLSERLKTLQNERLVTTAELPPPAARTVYRLTDEGRTVFPVLAAMARFGVRYLHGEPTPTFGATRAAHALLDPWRRRKAVALHVRLVLDGARGSDREVDIVLDGLATRIGPVSGTPDVVMTTTVAALVAARQPGGRLVAMFTGSAKKQAMFLAAFDLARDHDLA